jgi:predicted methyltransferase MtxX (methanogen marker protein 4)
MIFKSQARLKDQQRTETVDQHLADMEVAALSTINVELSEIMIDEHTKD